MRGSSVLLWSLEDGRAEGIYEGVSVVTCGCVYALCESDGGSVCDRGGCLHVPPPRFREGLEGICY